MTENRVFDPFAQPFAFDGIPAAGPLTRADLETIEGALKDFKEALADWERRREAEHRKAAAERTRQTEPEPAVTAAEADGTSTPGTMPPPAATASPDALHCLIVTGYLGKGYGTHKKMTTEEAVAQACARHFEANQTSSSDGYPVEPRLERIHVILDSYGGSLDSAYKIVLYLRAFAKEVRVYVPGHAKSAATLIAIGADRIAMSPFAELGPLDTQITDPRSPIRHVSALDCYRSVDYVREFGVQTISTALKVMLQETKTETQTLLPLTQLVDSATTFAVGSVKPLLEQVKALDFGGWGRTLRIGEVYAKALRLRLRYPDTEEDAGRMAARLVYGYPHHPFPIDRAEAKDLGITVDTMPKSLYLAARAIADACKDEARFVGFSEDVAVAISELKEPEDGARIPARTAATAGGDGSPQGTVVFAD